MSLQFTIHILSIKVTIRSEYVDCKDTILIQITYLLLKRTAATLGTLSPANTRKHPKKELTLSDFWIGKVKMSQQMLTKHSLLTRNIHKEDKFTLNRV
jgi:hypothetical protein